VSTGNNPSGEPLTPLSGGPGYRPNVARIVVGIAVVLLAGFLVVRYRSWFDKDKSAGGQAESQDRKRPVSELIDDLHSGDVRKRVQAAYQLADRGSEAKDAVPDLVQMLRDRDSRMQEVAAGALLKIGEPAVPALTELLRAREPKQVPAGRAAFVGAAAAGPLPAVSLLPVTPSDGDRRRREAAASILGQIGGEKALAVLRGGIKDSDPEVRRFSAQGLALMAARRGAVKEVLPDLAKAVKDPNRDVRLTAVVMLQLYVRPLPKEAAPPLISALTDRDALVRDRAVRALTVLGREGAEALPALARVMKDDPEVQIRLDAASAIWAISGKSKDLVPMLMDTLKSDNPVARGEAAVVVATIGKQDKEMRQALPKLRALLKDSDVRVRIRAALALWWIDGNTSDTLPVLRAGVLDRDPEVRIVAAAVLGDMKEKAKPAVDDLREMEKDKTNVSVRQAAREALKLIEPPPKEEMRSR
jgi:HEAT repeat protein